MDAKTLEALKASIAKWERNARVRNPDNFLTGPEDCPLCEIFIDQECDGCPVAKASLSTYCWGTPYIDAAVAQRRWSMGRSGTPARALAREEVAFLKSLLPAEEAQ